MADEDVTRILARYKEHVTFWNIRPEIVQRELSEVAEATGRTYDMVLSIYVAVAPKRLPPEYESRGPSRP